MPHGAGFSKSPAIATGALKPRVAVVLAGVLNLVGAFLSVEVAKTISGGLVDENRITPVVVFGALVGAILWNLLSWLLSLPSSSTHALFGGLIGATWVYAGVGAIKLGGVVGKVLLPLVLSPVVAGVVALVATHFVYGIAAHGAPDIVVAGFRRAQVLSASLVALAHGTNDAQKTMGVITLTLITVHALPSGSRPPLWVVGLCGVAIAAGTAIGGWRIIRTLGKRISDIQSPQGFTAETSSTTVILSSATLGFALSTTQVATGSIFGASTGRPCCPVQWGTAGKMVLSWLLTLPSAAAVAALAAWVASTGTAGTVAVAVVLVVLAGTIFGLSRRNPVTSSNVNDVEPRRPAVATGTA